MQTCLRRTSLFLVLTAVLAPPALAAERQDLNALDPQVLNQQYRKALGVEPAPANAATRHAEMLGLESGSDLRLIASRPRPDGGTEYRYQQTFGGLPVWGEHVVVSDDRAGRTRHLFGRRVDGIAADLGQAAPPIMAVRAREAARKAWLGSAAVAVENESSERSIFVDAEGKARDAYVVSFVATTAAGMTRPVVVVDARNARVIAKWEALDFALVGGGPGGNARTGQYTWGAGGILPYLDVLQSGPTCTMSNDKAATVNLSAGNGAQTPWSFPCPTNFTKPTNGAYAPINDVHAFATMAQSMFLAYAGERALPGQVVARVHSGNGANATWDGTNVNFGDGDSNFHPFTSVDVVGHEVGHGYTEMHSHLSAAHRQALSINESFSDIVGETLEHYWQGSNDFLLGAILPKVASSWPRNMANPPSDGHSIDDISNYVDSAFWLCPPTKAGKKNGKVNDPPDGICEQIEPTNPHHASGLFNKAFYTLSQKPGWGMVNAFKAFQYANAAYWTPSTNFEQGVCGVETAATAQNLPLWDVSEAFGVVGLQCPTSPPLLSLSDATVVEGNGGLTQAMFTLSMSRVAPSPVSVQLYTGTGTAGPSDYNGVSTTIVIPAGQLSVGIPVQLVGDTVVERNETFTVNIHSPVGAVVRKSQGLGVITNDDLPTMSIADATAVEGNTLTFTVSLNSPVDTVASFSYSTAAGGPSPATAGVDYAAASGTAFFDPGRTVRTITVSLTPDNLLELNETLLLNLSGVTGAIVGDSQAIGTISNDD
jgi:vibriolysin